MSILVTYVVESCVFVVDNNTPLFVDKYSLVVESCVFAGNCNINL